MNILLIESQCLSPVPVVFEMTTYDQVILEACETYQKRSYRNRIYLCGPQGPLHFTVPLKKGKHESQSIKEVQIAYEEDWIEQLTRLLRSAYSNAPFYQYYSDALISIFSEQFSSLFQLNRQLIDWVCEICQLRVNVAESSTYLSHNDLTTEFTDRRNYFTPAYFKRHASNIKYRQVYEAKHGFIPNLSILDMIMCCGPEIPLYFSSK